MKIHLKLTTLILSFSLFSFLVSAQEIEKNQLTTEVDSHEIKENVFPEFLGIINDFGKILTESQSAELSNILNDYEIETRRQIVLVTINSIEPYTDIQRFATDLGNYWDVGMTGLDNGLTIVVCNPCRQIAMTTGINTSFKLTDDICKEVIENTIIPKFKDQEFYEGIKNGVLELIEQWN